MIHERTEAECTRDKRLSSAHWQGRLEIPAAECKREHGDWGVEEWDEYRWGREEAAKDREKAS
jgi:hypothetical protein